MGIVKVLKRKDGASLVVGVTLGFLTYVFVTAVTAQLTDKLVGTTTVGDSFKTAYLAPTVQFLLSLVALELLIWVYVAIRSGVTGKK